MHDTSPPPTSDAGLPAGSWIEIVAIALVFGAFGGAASALYERRATADLTGRHLPLRSVPETLAHGALSGAVAGVSGLFVILLSPLSHALPVDSFWAFLCGISATLGYASDRIMPALQSTLFGKLNLLAKEIAENRILIQSNAGRDATERALDDALSPAAVPSVIQAGVDVAEGYLKGDRRARRPTIRLARLYFEKIQDKTSAIRILTQFIDYMEGLKSHTDDALHGVDLADMLYNRGCYVLNATGSNDGPLNPYVPTAQEISMALKDLGRCFQLHPANLEDARVDRDLEWLRANSPEFTRMLGNAPPT